jgi:ABC-2 type transport system ATP-binding protein
VNATQATSAQKTGAQVLNPIAIDDLHYSVQPNFWAKRKALLRGVTLHVEPGELFGFLGPNGAGKTTTIKAILGLLRPQAGSVRLFGQPPTVTEVRRRLGFMPERAYFPEHLTSRELLLQHGILAGMSLSQSRRRADAVLELVGMQAAARERLRNLSKGMQQRIGIGQALIAEPELVILDEPMSGLDPVGRHDLRELLIRLKAAGTTVFFSTHILPDVETICDRVAILVQGKVRRIEKLGDLMAGTVGSVEVLADDCSEAARASAAAHALGTASRFGSDLFVGADSEAANRIIDTLRAHQARIVAVHTERRSLEDVFVAESRRSDA